MVWWLFKKEDHSKRLKDLHINLDTSFSHIKGDMGAIKEWIDHFKDKHEVHENKLKSIEDRLKIIEGSVQGLDSSVQAFMNVQASKLIDVKNDEKDVIDRSHMFTHVHTDERSSDMFTRVQDVKNLTKSLTPAQKRVLAVLTYSGGPVGYEEIAKKLEIAEVTARRHINDILRAGVKVDKRVSGRNRKKMFSLDKKIKGIIIKRK